MVQVYKKILINNTIKLLIMSKFNKALMVELLQKI